MWKKKHFKTTKEEKTRNRLRRRASEKGREATIDASKTLLLRSGHALSFFFQLGAKVDRQCVSVGGCKGEVSIAPEGGQRELFFFPLSFFSKAKQSTRFRACSMVEQRGSFFLLLDAFRNVPRSTRPAEETSETKAPCRPRKRRCPGGASLRWEGPLLGGGEAKKKEARPKRWREEESERKREFFPHFSPFFFQRDLRFFIFSLFLLARFE